MGHTWRWELAEATPGRTTVTETFDYTRVPAPAAKMFDLTGRPRANGDGMTHTLEQLQRRFEG